MFLIVVWLQASGRGIWSDKYLKSCIVRKEIYGSALNDEWLSQHRSGKNKIKIL